MTQEDSKNLKKKISSGVFSLSLRTGITNILQIASSLILANFLAPGDYGVFGIFAGWVGTLAFFTDFGIGQTLVLQKRDLEASQVETYLGIRILLSACMILLFVLAFPWISSYYKLNIQNGQYLTLYSIVLFFDVLSSIPRLYFHKNLEFTKMAKLDMIGSLSLYIIQISLAILGFGFWVFFIASVVRSFISVFIGHYLAGHKLVLPKINWNVFKGQYKLGFKYHLNGLVPVTKSIVVPLVMAKAFTVDDIGLIFWLTNMVSLPKQIFYNYNHVLFASMAKLSDQESEFKRVASQISSVAIIGVFLIFASGALLGPGLIKILFGAKFHHAADFIHISALAVGLSVLEFIFIPILSSTGKPGLVNRSQLLSLGLDVILTYFLSQKFGLIGYFWGQVIIYACTGTLLHFYAHKYFDANFYKRIILVIGLIFFIALTPEIGQVWTNGIIKLVLTAVFMGLYIFILDKNLVIGIKNYIRPKS
ncbi:MAG: lipopolysaccharide biosynthesis protein [Bacteriovoracaceae bacterium]